MAVAVETQVQSIAVLSVSCSDLAAVAKFASTNKTRPILTNVLIEWDSDKVCATATDGFRLHHFEEPIYNRDGASVAVQVLASDLATACKGQRGYLSMALDGDTLWIGKNPVTVRNDGPYPNYRQLIRKDSPTAVTVDRARMEEACHAAKALGEVIMLDTEARALQVRGNGTRSEIEWSDGCVSDTHVTTAYDPRFILDLLVVTRSQHLSTIRFDMAEKNPHMAPANVELPHGIHVIMPRYMGR
jgi:hypothetical protein